MDNPETALESIPQDLIERLEEPAQLKTDATPHPFDAVDNMLSWVRSGCVPDKHYSKTGGVYIITGGSGQGKTFLLRVVIDEIVKWQKTRRGDFHVPKPAYFDFDELPVKRTLPEWLEYKKLDESFAKGFKDNESMVFFFDHIETVENAIGRKNLFEWENYMRNAFGIGGPYKTNTKVFVACNDKYYASRIGAGALLFGVKPVRVSNLQGINPAHPEYGRVSEAIKKHNEEKRKRNKYFFAQPD